MSSTRCIQILHSDDALVAELSFWATSAGYDLVALERKSDLLRENADSCAAVIFELTGTSDEDVDVIEALSKCAHVKIIAVTQLDGKTIASVRRLFQAKSIDAVLMSRTDFNTRQLADLLQNKEIQPSLDGETLAQLIADGHVVVHYQPKVPFRAGEKNYGVEALCRIQHPTLGMIFPDNFIPLAEAHDVILELTDAVTVQAFRDLHAWDAQGRELRIAINISPRLMGSMTWFELFEHRCQEHCIDPKRITLEVTESSSQGGKVLALEILSRLRLKGFLLSIDDFGTGFSSLETLYKLPFGELTIDKGFVFDLLKSAEARTLVESTIGLARKLGLKICAEGVESEELFHELRNLQCDDAQGYFISKPIAASAIAPFFQQWEADNAARGNSAATRLKAIHGLLAEILSGPDDEDDATVVVGSMPGVESGRDIAAKLPALVLSGDLVGSLSLVHHIVRAELEPEFRSKLLSLQAELERSLLNDRLVISDGERTARLLAGESFTIGRESSSAGADVSIPCQWLSRGSKNLRLFVENGNWHVCDLGSTNGHFMNGVRLKPNVPVALASGDTTLEVGKTGSEPAPAWLRLRISRENAVELSFGVLDGVDSAAVSQKWLMFHQELSVGRDAEAGLVISGSGSEFAADISSHDHGMWIAPRPGSTVFMGGREFSQAVPLAVGCDINLGAAVWHVEKANSADVPQIAPVPVAASA
jgi:EAL domain-containing protein (putative c-di-GMP-specific phosphodiesterase class I)/pSer/pThr/pTyr-binding forkhead associated (FHA) protein